MEVTQHDRGAELGVIAGCMVSKGARDEARKTITGKDIHDPVLEGIWDAMSRLDHHSKPVDPITVMAVVQTQRGAREAMIEVATTYVVAEQVPHYAAIVRSWATKRRIHELATRVRQQSLNPDANAVGFAASVASQFAAIRDIGQDDEVTARTLDEFEALEVAEYDWLVEGLLERGDRLVLTGAEGLGKSTLLRQVAVYAAAGIHPFKPGKRIEPLKALVYDSENSVRQIKRKIHPLHQAARQHGQRDPGPHVMIDCPGRIDITRDRDLSRIHRLLDAMQPDILVCGPLYRLSPRAIQTDDEASPLLAALDTIKDRGIALMIEAHAGHGTGKEGRDWRPRGSSALMGWPEFGYGMNPLDDGVHCDMVPWRGARDERDWKMRLRRNDATQTWLDVDQVSRPYGVPA